MCKDFSSNGREISKAVQGVFPNRLRVMLIINGGMLISALLTAAKFVLPKKLVKRVKQVSIHIKTLFIICFCDVARY